ncbi:hypothetical protein ACWEQN_47095 [Streptomyces sp. NPDC004129]|uniref:hypothetical protein n=1 Tax=Streptomyces sp. NPDC004533 TaxID=3154278 RepID=UPI0033B150D4
MVQHDDFSVFDGALYRWGAMGHDGFQQIDALTMPLKSVGDTYNFVRQGFYKLDANSVINAHQSPLFGAHSDICHPEVLWAVVSAAGLDGQPQ